MKIHTHVIARYEATSELFRTKGKVMNNLTTCPCSDCFAPCNDVAAGRDAPTHRGVSTRRFTLCAILFCLIQSVNALAQNSDTVHKDTAKRFTIVDAKPIDNHEKPLYVVDGIIFEGDIKRINPKDILDITVLKQPGSTNIYGPQGANGVVLITTKQYQKVDRTTAKFTDPIFDKLVFVVDGIMINKKEFSEIDPRNILIFDDSQIKKDTVIVVTKSFAINQYQKKFSAFSEKYKSYLESHQNKDDDFLYILDGVQVQGKQNEIISALYKTPSEKIKEVGFNVKEPTDGSKTLVIINTKQ
jgi:TonB-dependent SusC/RagA subfamily outer membrane receptor